MKPTVYVETSVISYLTGHPARDVIVAGRQALTIEWWGACRQRFDVFVSALVVTEAEDGDPTAAQRRLVAIKDVPALDVSDEAKVLAHKMVTGGPIPKEYPEDHVQRPSCRGSSHCPPTALRSIQP